MAKRVHGEQASPGGTAIEEGVVQKRKSAIRIQAEQRALSCACRYRVPAMRGGVLATRYKIQDTKRKRTQNRASAHGYRPTIAQKHLHAGKPVHVQSTLMRNQRWATLSLPFCLFFPPFLPSNVRTSLYPSRPGPPGSRWPGPRPRRRGGRRRYLHCAPLPFPCQARSTTQRRASPRPFHALETAARRGAAPCSVRLAAATPAACLQCVC